MRIMYAHTKQWSIMNSADTKNWQFAGQIEGQGVRRLMLGERRLLVVQFRDEVLVIDAGCRHCGEALGTEISEIAELVCGHCGGRQTLSSSDHRQGYPMMVVDSEIYVLLETDDENKETRTQ